MKIFVLISDKVRLDHAVCRIDQTDNGVSIMTTDGERYTVSSFNDIFTFWLEIIMRFLLYCLNIIQTFYALLFH